MSATAVLADRRTYAREAGRRLGTLVDDPDLFATAAYDALRDLADGPYREELERVAPGIREALGVRGPMIGALIGGLRPALRRSRPAEALWVAERLSGSDVLEVRHLALAFLGRSLAEDPERTWQLIRRLGRRASDWISVDSLAALVAEGILREPYRWAEIEQLVFAESPWERRLVASSVANLRARARELAARRAIAAPLGSAEVSRGLAVIGTLMGDTDPNVRKALAWAIRELVPIDRRRVTAFVREQAEIAAAERDGHRAWVLRDALVKLDPADAVAVRARLAGLRRSPGRGLGSTAARIASGFGRLPDPRSMSEPPL